MTAANILAAWVATSNLARIERAREVKTCSICGISKSIDSFSPVVTNTDGHANRCRECASFINRGTYRIKQLTRGKRPTAQRENVQKERGE